MKHIEPACQKTECLKNSIHSPVTLHRAVKPLALVQVG
jgi:hypothetical protein